MPTPRKRYFRVADAILREPWPRETKLTMVLLMAWLNQRWARDGLSAEEAGRAVLSRSALAEVTGRHRLDSARVALRKLAEVVSISIEYRDDFTVIHWPKFPEFQNFGAEVGPKSGLEPALDPPLPRPASRGPRPRERETEAARSAEPTEAGETLSLSDVLKIRPDWTEPEGRAWLAANLPAIEADVAAGDPEATSEHRAAQVRAKGLKWARDEKGRPAVAIQSKPRTTRDRVLAHLHTAFPEREHFTEEQIEAHWRHFGEQCEWEPYQPPGAETV